MQKLILLLIPLLFLTACFSDNPNKNKIETTSDNVERPKQTEQPPNKEEDLIKFFMKDKSTAVFKGEGNEYASYTLKTVYLYDHYIATYEDNGGTVLERIYRISDDRISLIAKKEEAYEVKTPALKELEALPELEVYLATPLKVGTEFDGWKITSTTDTIKTSLQTFENVIVIEQIDKQGFTIRKYFAKNFGEIKREFIMQEGDEEFIVTSTIESVN